MTDIVKHRWLLVEGEPCLGYRVTSAEWDPSPEWVYTARDIMTYDGASMVVSELGELRRLRADGTCSAPAIDYQAAKTAEAVTRLADAFKSKLREFANLREDQPLRIIGVDP